MTGKVFGCGNSGDTHTAAILAGSFSKSPLNCATMGGTGAIASLDIAWRPEHEGRYITGSGPTIQYNPSVVSSTGSQIETTATGEIGVAIPGNGFSASTTGSFSGASATAVGDLYFSNSPSQLASACNSRHGIAKLNFTGDITLSNYPEVASTFPGSSIGFAEGITTGPDGNLWFINGGSSARDIPTSIGRITPSGVVSSFTDPSLDGPRLITTGSDGNLWFTNNGGTGVDIGDPGSIGRITPSGVVSKFTDPSIDHPFGITAGPDGNLWFANQGTSNVTSGSIGEITPAGEVSNFPVLGGSPYNIATGPDGALWFTDGTSIGRITTAGVISTYPVTFTSCTNCYTNFITAGPDGALWFTTGTNSNYQSLFIGRITTAGVVSEFPVAEAGDAITTGPDGNLWFVSTSNSGNVVSRITPAGVVTGPFTGPVDGVPTQVLYTFGSGIATGPDGNIWFTEDNSIERINP
ncbi:MAG: hypothetical protein WB565_08105 [Acidimicrobiales bacterium]